MERAGIDIVTDGEIRRESYSNRFATALDGIDGDNPAMIVARTGNTQTPVPRVVGPVKRKGPVELHDMLIEFVLIRRLYGRSIDDPLLLTFGLSYILVEGVRIVFGSDGIPFPTPPQLIGVVDLGIGFFPRYRLFVIALVAVVLLVLWLTLEKTRVGLIVRAGARDPTIMLARPTTSSPRSARMLRWSG